MVKYDRHLDLTFAALADPTRRGILARLALGPATVGELAEPFAMSLPAVSKHLDVLEGAALITRRRDGRFRRCALDPARLAEASDFLETYRRFWAGNLGRLKRYLDGGPDRGHPRQPGK